jgi:general secretion pathway protein H
MWERSPGLPARGFTLIELMLVVALIAVAAGVTSLALRDPQASQLEREAARLVSLLEMGRAQARGSGLAVQWVPAAGVQASSASGDFTFLGLPAALQLPTRWLDQGVSAEVVGGRSITLGPEPLIGAQRIVLRLGSQHLLLSTDGLSPFTVTDPDTVAAGAR